MRKYATTFNQRPVVFSGTKVPEVRQEEVDAAVQEYLNRGGNIERVQMDPADGGPRKVNVHSRWSELPEELFIEYS